MIVDHVYMVYLVGTIGFFSGFSLGILILNALLQDRSRRELLENRGLKWTYGLFAWIIAGITAYAAVQSYKMYF